MFYPDLYIWVTWEVMKDWTDVGYTARIQHLMKEYHLTFRRIEQIIKEEE